MFEIGLVLKTYYYLELIIIIQILTKSTSVLECLNSAEKIAFLLHNFNLIVKDLEGT